MKSQCTISSNNPIYLSGGHRTPLRSSRASIGRLGVVAVFSASIGCFSSGPDCLEESRSLGIDEAVDFGMSAQMALASIGLQGSLPLSWYARPGILDFAGKGTQSVLSWSLLPNLDSVRFVDSKVNPRNTNENVKECYDRIEIDANLQLSSEDQWLNENALPVVIRFVAENHDAPQGARWQNHQSEIPIEEIMGQLPSGLKEKDNEPHGNNFFEIDGWSGFDGSAWIQIDATTIVRDKDSVTHGVTDLGCASTVEEQCQEPM